MGIAFYPSGADTIRTGRWRSLDSRARFAHATRVNGGPQAISLISSYDAAVEAIVREAGATGAGDRIEAALYVLEAGESSARVVAAFADAARRGVEVEVSLDWTPASHLSRLWERTSTLWPAVRALADELPGRVRAVQVRATDHSKVIVFRRAAGEPSALLGSLNLGDRFRAWRDLLVRVEGREAVDDLLRARRGERSAGAAGAGGGAPIAFVANVPAAGAFPTRPALEALFGDARFGRYRIAMAYLDRTGAALLHLALARGASVDLVLPRRANVYQHANLRALDGLLRRDGGLVRAYLHPAMVHAKAILALDGAGEGGGAALVGSANLKRNSIDRFGETAVLASAPAFVAALDREIDRLAAEAEPARPPLRYGAARAAIEERFG